MRIHFASAERPKSVARKLRKIMKERGEPIAQHRSLDIVASLYGYRDWQELSASVGKRPASHDDPDVMPEIVAARRAQQVEALRGNGFPDDLADRLATLLGATGSSVSASEIAPPHILDSLLHRAFRSNATDVHVEPHDGHYSVRFRRSGDLELVHVGPSTEYEVVRERLKDRAAMDMNEARATQEGRFRMEYAGDVYELRVATFPTATGEQLVARLLDPEHVSPRLTDTGISTVEDWSDALRWTSIFVIASSDPEVRRRVDEATRRDLTLERKNVSIFEREAGYRILNVVTTRWNKPVESVLKRFMRQDPNVVAVGDLTDVGIARSVRDLHGAGHPVLATIDAGTMEEAVRALREFGFTDAEIRWMSVLLADGVGEDYVSYVDGKRSAA